MLFECPFIPRVDAAVRSDREVREIVRSSPASDVNRSQRIAWATIIRFVVHVAIVGPILGCGVRPRPPKHWRPLAWGRSLAGEFQLGRRTISSSRASRLRRSVSANRQRDCQSPRRRTSTQVQHHPREHVGREQNAEESNVSPTAMYTQESSECECYERTEAH